MTGMNLRRARKLWLAHGGLIHPVPKTGEERYYAAIFDKPITVDAHSRKDAPRSLTTALKKLIRWYNSKDGISAA